jgi:hypothetical protein
MVTRDQFRQIVRKMQDEGVPLTMANLMVRTELPRATIEDWLDDLQRGATFAKPERPPASEASGDESRASEKRGGDGAVQGLRDRAKSLKSEVLTDVVKKQLGMSTATNRGPQRQLKLGATLGLVLPPAGLAYSAPITTAVAGTVVYAALLTIAMMFPFLGIPYVLIPLHLLGGAAGFAYAWRFNRAGKRTPLLPKGERAD